MIKCFIGLGNPAGYELTRHNIGMQYLDSLSTYWSRTQEGQESRINSALLFKPNSYMNVCGPTIKSYLKRKQINLSEIIIIHDDLELDIGVAKLKQEGSAKGHNGVRSLISSLGLSTFQRLRIGIGRPSSIDVADYVLSRFTRVELEIIQSTSFPLCNSLLKITP